MVICMAKRNERSEFFQGCAQRASPESEKIGKMFQ